MTLTLRARLALVSTAVVAGLLAGFGLASYRVLAQRLDADATARLAELSEGLHGFLRPGPGGPSVQFDPADREQADFVHEATRYYRVYDAARGQTLRESYGMAALGRLLPPPGRDAPAGPIDVESGHGRIRVSTSTVPGGAGQTYLLQVGVPLAQADLALSRYRGLLGWGVLPALVAAALSSWWLSRFALAPLDRMAAAARAIDVTALHQRLPARGAGDELDTLAAAFNEALERLERAVGEMRQFSASLAHELRTPLAAMRGEAELALRRAGTSDEDRTAFASQVEEIDRLTRLIEQILTLARAESGQIPLSFARVDLRELSFSLLEQIEAVAQARGIELACECTGPVFVQGDEGWLRRLLLNLIDNALKYTPPGGNVRVRASGRGRFTTVEVIDSGAGMTPEVAARAFERFYRGAPSAAAASEGAGLGLPLARWIVERHAGTIAVASRPGEGSTFTVTLPAA